MICCIAHVTHPLLNDKQKVICTVQESDEFVAATARRHDGSSHYANIVSTSDHVMVIAEPL